MLIPVPALIKEILALGRKFPWPRPAACPTCRYPLLWGHGFVRAYFDGLTEGLWLRRYRCPLCGSVHRLKPQGFFPRFQASIQEIRVTLACRLRSGRWPPRCCRQRCSHWLKSLRRQVMAHLGHGFMGCLLSGFDFLISLGEIPVTRSL